ncbi:hypothetical protein [Iningainema tapete]|uniref:Uncharacterized protein n=1 Tax=Iningainema tapete BLCC-T55 TaxID=2748662 RepID=A0A8J7BXT6_9CYAN|nr:hypothetical protein [Iningainema tapete]MBD2773463.1 hypothetical protein [Iningainema tapete BLCC-T55]
MTYQIRDQESHLQVPRGIDADKILELEEKVEFLLEQIESLKQYLCHKNYELQQIEQELGYTNKELRDALNAKLLNINEAMELAKNLLASNKPTKDILAELLIAIYSSW